MGWVRGTGPALAGNVGMGGVFALAREGGEGVDVPVLAPAQSRCCFGRRYGQCHFCYSRLYYSCVARGFVRKRINRDRLPDW